MPLTRRVSWVIVATFIAVIGAIWATPFAISRGLQWWIGWKAHQQHLTVEIDRIDAPLLRPVVLHGIHFVSAPENPFVIDIKATQATLDLNLKAVLLRVPGRAIRTLAVEDFRAEMRRQRAGASLSEAGWTALQRSLPANFAFNHIDLRLEDGPTVLLLRNAQLSGSEIEAGRFHGGEITIASPWFRQTFTQLSGATNWQSNRLTLAGLSLALGLDLQWIAIDLSQLGRQRLSLDFEMDAFAGKLRGSVSNEWSAKGSTWNVAGSGNDISLGRTAQALGFTDEIGGWMRACKFTFRGDPHDPMQATASLWAELTGLSWRERAAEIIMLGASLYNRQIDIQQVYVKQSKNQLTLRGEAVLPTKTSDWLTPDFRGDISASIDQLGDFAALFGANPRDFSGKIAIEGTMNARERTVAGHLTCHGADVTLFHTAIDALNAKANLQSNNLEIEEFELKRGNDVLSAQGKIDLTHDHDYSGVINASSGNLAEYLSIFRAAPGNRPKPAPGTIQATISSSTWAAHGTIDLPDSSPLTFTANFHLPIHADWNALRASPVAVAVDFPSLFLGGAPQMFQPAVFRDGILSGKFDLSGTLRNPRIVGDVHLLNGKLRCASVNLTEASAHVVADGNRATIQFFHAAANDVDLALQGAIDFGDTDHLSINLTYVTPMFDLTPREISCVNSIEIVPVTATLAPALMETEIRRSTLGSAWAMQLKERPSVQSMAGLTMGGIERNLPLCLGAGPEENTFVLGAPPRPSPPQQKARPRQRAKQR